MSKCALAGAKVQKNYAERRFGTLRRENRVPAGYRPCQLGHYFEAEAGEAASGNAQFSRSPVARSRFNADPLILKIGILEKQIALRRLHTCVG